MELNAMRIRLGLMGAGMVTLLIYVAMGGKLGPSHQGTVLVDFSMYPDDFSGSVVQIDGEPAGTLRAVGAQYRNGFAVDAGPHEISLVNPRFPSGRRTLEVGAGRTVMLILNYAETRGANGRPETVISFDG